MCRWCIRTLGCEEIYRRPPQANRNLCLGAIAQVAIGMLPLLLKQNVPWQHPIANHLVDDEGPES